MKRILTLALVALTTLSGSAWAHGYKIGSLEIHHPHARATPPGAPVAGGFMTIRNTGAEPDRLIGGEASFAGEMQVHEMKMDGDVMRMREIEGGLEVPAGGEVELKPGGYHVMFMKLGEQLKEGERRKATLKFEKAGTIEVEFAVEKIDAGHGNMDHGKMDHSGKHGGMSMPAGDAEQITMMMKEHFDRADAPLTVEPVVVSGEWAVAGWFQEGRGGRGLLRKDGDGWYIHMCGGEGFKQAGNLMKAGIPHHDAMTIAAGVSEAEAKLGSERIALFDSFEGVVEIGKGGHHGHGDAGQHQKHGHGG